MSIELKDLYGSGVREKIPHTRRFRSSQVKADSEYDLTRDELKKALTEYKEKGSVPDDLKEKFDHFFKDPSLAETYLKSSSRGLTSLLANYIYKEAANADGEKKKTLLGLG